MTPRDEKRWKKRAALKAARAAGCRCRTNTVRYADDGAVEVIHAGDCAVFDAAKAKATAKQAEMKLKDATSWVKARAK